MNFYLVHAVCCSLDAAKTFLQSSSLDFLAGCGFDFNKFIYEGVSYMPGKTRSTQLWRGVHLLLFCMWHCKIAKLLSEGLGLWWCSCHAECQTGTDGQVAGAGGHLDHQAR